jgi:uncharacterized repeat protein (TIGR01451 family)
MRKTIATLFLAGLAAVAAPLALAQVRPAAGSIELKNVAEVDADVKTADGKTEKQRVPVQKAIPGTVVFYTSTFKNISAKPAGSINITNPVPANTTLVAASAYGENMDISYSADGGKTWAAADKVRVKTPDGKERPAALSELTHIKWVQRGELPAGKQGEAGFRVVIN